MPVSNLFGDTIDITEQERINVSQFGWTTEDMSKVQTLVEYLNIAEALLADCYRSIEDLKGWTDLYAQFTDKYTELVAKYDQSVSMHREIVDIYNQVKGFYATVVQAQTDFVTIRDSIASDATEVANNKDAVDVAMKAVQALQTHYEDVLTQITAAATKADTQATAAAASATRAAASDTHASTIVAGIDAKLTQAASSASAAASSATAAAAGQAGAEAALAQLNTQVADAKASADAAHADYVKAHQEAYNATAASTLASTKASQASNSASAAAASATNAATNANTAVAAKNAAATSESLSKSYAADALQSKNDAQAIKDSIQAAVDAGVASAKADVQTLVAQADTSAANADASAQAAAATKTETAQIKADTQAIKDATDQLKTDTQTIKDDVLASEARVDQIRQDAVKLYGSLQAVNTAVGEAQASATASAQARDAAQAAQAAAQNIVGLKDAVKSVDTTNHDVVFKGMVVSGGLTVSNTNIIPAGTTAADAVLLDAYNNRIPSNPSIVGGQGVKLPASFDKLYIINGTNKDIKVYPNRATDIIYAPDTHGNLNTPTILKGMSTHEFVSLDDFSTRIGIISNGVLPNDAHVIGALTADGAITAGTTVKAMGQLKQHNASIVLHDTAQTGAGPFGYASVAIGINTQTDTCGANAVAIGNEAGKVNQGSNAVAIGDAPGHDNQGPSAVAIGITAGQANQGTKAVAIGSQAGNSAQAASTVAVGNQTGQVSQAQNAVAIGTAAGQTNQGGSSVAVGNASGQTRQDASSVAIGDNAGNNTQATRAVAVGHSAGSVTQSAYCVAIGDNAGQQNQGGDTGDASIAIGMSAGQVTQGTRSIAIGRAAGMTTQGDSAIAIGFGAGQTSQPANSIALGNNATPAAASDVAIKTNTVDLQMASNGVIRNLGFSVKTVRTIILNAAGTTQADAQSTGFNTYLVVNNPSDSHVGGGIRLPATSVVPAGFEVTVYNNGGDLRVYPNSGESVLGLSTDTPLIIRHSESATFTVFQPGKWSITGDTKTTLGSLTVTGMAGFQSDVRMTHKLVVDGTLQAGAATSDSQVPTLAQVKTLIETTTEMYPTDWVETTYGSDGHTGKVRIRWAENDVLEFIQSTHFGVSTTSGVQALPLDMTTLPAHPEKPTAKWNFLNIPALLVTSRAFQAAWFQISDAQHLQIYRSPQTAATIQSGPCEGSVKAFVQEVTA